MPTAVQVIIAAGRTGFLEPLAGPVLGVVLIVVLIVLYARRPR